MKKNEFAVVLASDNRGILPLSVTVFSLLNTAGPETFYKIYVLSDGIDGENRASVERLAAANGFDSWIMFNVYPQRATDPNDMDRVPDRALCDENLRWLRAVLAETEPTMWAAWGTLIEKRDYLPGLMREMVALTREREIPWVTFGKRSKKGHPHHPLYLRKDSTPEPFDVEEYLDTCF